MLSPTVTVSDFDIGPCQVKFNSVDLGGTAGNVKIKFKYEKAVMMADQYGKTNLDKAVSGMSCSVETEFLEVLNKTNIQKAFPSLTVSGTTHKYNDMIDRTAVRQLSTSAALRLHPLVDDATNADNEWYFWKACANEDSEYMFSPSEQAKLKISWDILLDTSVSPARLFRYGDQSL
jgi:hypothetical protein